MEHDKHHCAKNISFEQSPLEWVIKKPTDTVRELQNHSTFYNVDFFHIYHCTFFPQYGQYANIFARKKLFNLSRCCPLIVQPNYIFSWICSCSFTSFWKYSKTNSNQAILNCFVFVMINNIVLSAVLSYWCKIIIIPSPSVRLAPFLQRRPLTEIIIIWMKC